MLPSPFRLAASRARKRSAAEEKPVRCSAQACTEAAAPGCSGAKALQPDVGSSDGRHPPCAAQQRPASRSPLLPIAAQQTSSAEPQSPCLSASPARRAASLQHAPDRAPQAGHLTGASDHHGGSPRPARRRALVLSSPESPDIGRSIAGAAAGPGCSDGIADDDASVKLRVALPYRAGPLDAFLQRRPNDAAMATSEPEEAAPEPTKPWKQPRSTVWCDRDFAVPLAALSTPASGVAHALECPRQNILRGMVGFGGRPCTYCASGTALRGPASLVA